MRKWTIAAGALASALLASGRAEACATVTFNVSPVSYTTWNPINPGQQTVSVTATVNRTLTSAQPNSPRSYRLILLDNTGEASPVIGSTGPTYQVLSGATNILFKTGTAITGLSTGTVPTMNLGNGNGGDSVTQSLSYVVPANSGTDYVGGTVYNENLSFAVQCYTGNNGTGTSTTGGPAGANSVSLTIPKLVSLVTATPQTINFGNFTTTTQTLQVGLKSTSSVNVAVTSGNQMVLAGAVTPFPSNSVIPYTMTLNGDTIANGSSLTNRPRATVVGTNWPLILTLTGGVPSGKLAGGYSDTITLTMSPGI
jgi:hypothetical protein